MKERLFEQPIKLEQIEQTINAYMEDQILKLKEKEILEKWNHLSLVIMEKDEVRQKFLEVVTYIDDLTNINKEDKIRYITTLSYLVVKERLKITKMDENNIYLLLSHLDKVPLENLKDTLKYLNNTKLLEKIRIKTLDLEIRKKIIAYIDKQQMSIEETIKWLENEEYYDMLKLIS